MAPQIFQRLQHTRELVVQCPGTPGDLLGVAVLALEAPHALDGAQGRQQRGRTHHDDVALEGPTEQRRVALHGLHEGGLDRHEDEHEVERADALERRVVLHREGLDVRGERGDVRAQRRLARLLGLGRAEALPVGQRHLGVDHHVAPFRQAHDHVGQAPLAVRVDAGHLRLELASLVQAGLLEDALEDHLAPVSLHLAVALQRARQAQRLVAHPPVELLQRRDLVQQARARLGVAGVDLVDATAEVGELLAQRVQREIERGPAVLAEPVGLLLENAVGDRRELERELLAGLGEQRQLVRRRARLRSVPGPRLREFRARAGERLPQFLGTRLVPRHVGLAPCRLAQRRVQARLLRRRLGLGAAHERLQRGALAPRARLQHRCRRQQAEQERRRGDEHVIEVGNQGLHCGSVIALVIGRLYAAAAAHPL